MKKKEKKTFFKNKVQMVIYLVLSAICIALFIVIGTTDYKPSQKEEALKFSSIFNLVSENNVYEFCNATDVLEIINGRNGIILMGFNKNKWTNYYASILNNAALELNVDKICYYDFLKDREENNGTYETIVRKLSNFAPSNDEEIQDIMAPTVLMIKNGYIIAYIDETAYRSGSITAENYYTEERMNSTYLKFKNAIYEYLN